MTELGNQIQEVQRKQNELLLSHIITLLLKDTYLTFFPDIDSDFETGTSKDTKLKQCTGKYETESKRISNTVCNLYILSILKTQQNNFTQDRYTETIPHRVCTETNVGEYNKNR